VNHGRDPGEEATQLKLSEASEYFVNLKGFNHLHGEWCCGGFFTVAVDITKMINERPDRRVYYGWFTSLY